MSHPSQPTRLLDDPRVGDLMESLRSRVPSDERIARVGEKLARVAESPPGSVDAGTGTSGSAATAVLAGSALLLGSAALIVALGTLAEPDAESPSEPEPESPAMAVEPTALPLPVPPAADAQPESNPASAAREELPGDVPRRPGRARVTVPTEPTPTEPTPTNRSAPASSTGTLAAELGLYDRARAAVRAGEWQAANATLDELMTRFPGSALAPEVELTRVDILVRSGMRLEARAALARMLASPTHDGRRAELHRLEGDLWLSDGDCERAAQAYRRSLALRPTAAVARAAEAGLRRCPGPSFPPAPE